MPHITERTTHDHRTAYESWGGGGHQLLRGFPCKVVLIYLYVYVLYPFITAMTGVPSSDTPLKRSRLNGTACDVYKQNPICNTRFFKNKNSLIRMRFNVSVRLTFFILFGVNL